MVPMKITMPSYAEKKMNETKKNLLFYHISGLSFGGTEKFLQIMAKNIDKNKYNVFFMYAPQSSEGRKSYLSKDVELIPFTYKKKLNKFPFYIEEMNPKI